MVVVLARVDVGDGHVPTGHIQSLAVPRTYTAFIIGQAVAVVLAVVC